MGHVLPRSRILSTRLLLGGFATILILLARSDNVQDAFDTPSFCRFYIAFSAAGKADANPQTCLFSATLPVWVHQTAKKYMRDTVKKVDLIGQQLQRAATNVQVTGAGPRDEVGRLLAPPVMVLFLGCVFFYWVK